MRYTVKFQSRPHMGAIDKKSRLIGWEEVNKIRNLDKFIPLSKITGYTMPIIEDPTISVPGYIAEKEEVFRNNHEILVEVPQGHLNAFCYESIEIKSDEESIDREAEMAYVKNKLDRKRVFYEWRDAGCPTRWGFNDEGCTTTQQK